MHFFLCTKNFIIRCVSGNARSFMFAQGHTRLKAMPSNPQRLEDLGEIPAEFKKTLSGENFFIYDTYEDDDNDNDTRVIVFATTENLRMLFRCSVWFVDGTFKISPSIFFQVFAILGALTQPDNKGGTQTIGLPFVYALSESKEQIAYRKIFDAVLEHARRHELNLTLPSTIMSDFEIGIIN